MVVTLEGIYLPAECTDRSSLTQEQEDLMPLQGLFLQMSSVIPALAGFNGHSSQRQRKFSHQLLELGSRKKCFISYMITSKLDQKVS